MKTSFSTAALIFSNIALNNVSNGLLVSFKFGYSLIRRFTVPTSRKVCDVDIGSHIFSTTATGKNKYITLLLITKKEFVSKVYLTC